MRRFYFFHPHPIFITAKTPFHHCKFSFITAHFVHHCTLKHALLQFNKNGKDSASSDGPLEVTGSASVWYFGESHLATLSASAGWTALPQITSKHIVR